MNFSPYVLNVDLNKYNNEDIKKLALKCARELLVVIPKQNIELSRLNDINHLWGHHNVANIWCNHKEHPIFFRVTNKEVEENKPGLFSRGHLEWHCNGVFAPDPEQCVSLYCVTPGEEGNTQFLNTQSVYRFLPESLKKDLQESTIVVTNIIKDTYLKRSAYETLLPYEQKALDKMSTRNRKCAGGDSNNKWDQDKKYVQTGRSDLPGGLKRLKRREVRLVQTHPVTGQKGIYFPFYCIEEIRGLPKELSSSEVFFLLKDECLKEENIYTHRWQEGDLILTDQIHSLHRRDEIKGERELLRSAFWYN